MRDRAYLGIHPLLPKAVLPTIGMWFEEDWKDLADMHVPFLLERVVVADRGAAERGRANWRPAAPSGSASGAPDMNKRAVGQEGEPVWAAPFVGLNAPDGWWAPMRSALLRYLHIPDMLLHKPGSHGGGFWGKNKQGRKPVVSYVSMQDMPPAAGPRLSPEDHQKLVSGLRRLEQEGVLGEVHVLSGNGTVPAIEWTERMGAIALSTVSVQASCQVVENVCLRARLW